MVTYTKTTRARWWGFVGIMAILAVFSGLLVYGFGGDATNGPLTLTKEGLTVRLTAARSITDGVELMYSPDRTSEDPEIYHISVPSIRNDDGVSLYVTSDAGTSGGIIAKIETDLSDLPESGSMHADLGSWIVSDPGLSGTSTFSLSQDISDEMPDSGESNTITVSGTISVGNRSYGITELVLDRRTEYEVFYLKVVPTNDAALKTELASTNVASVSLTDNASGSYAWVGTRTRWQESNRGEKRIAWQQLSFEGLPALTVSSFSLGITGGGNVVGPFVFENAVVVSEETGSSGTPQGPGSGSESPTGPTGEVGK